MEKIQKHLISVFNVDKSGKRCKIVGEMQVVFTRCVKGHWFESQLSHNFSPIKLNIMDITDNVNLRSF